MATAEVTEQAIDKILYLRMATREARENFINIIGTWFNTRVRILSGYYIRKLEI